MFPTSQPPSIIQTYASEALDDVFLTATAPQRGHHHVREMPRAFPESLHATITISEADFIFSETIDLGSGERTSYLKLKNEKELEMVDVLRQTTAWDKLKIVQIDAPETVHGMPYGPISVAKEVKNKLRGLKDLSRSLLIFCNKKPLFDQVHLEKAFKAAVEHEAYLSHIRGDGSPLTISTSIPAAVSSAHKAQYQSLFAPYRIAVVPYELEPQEIDLTPYFTPSSNVVNRGKQTYFTDKTVSKEPALVEASANKIFHNKVQKIAAEFYQDVDVVVFLPERDSFSQILDQLPNEPLMATFKDSPFMPLHRIEEFLADIYVEQPSRANRLKAIVFDNYESTVGVTQEQLWQLKDRMLDEKLGDRAKFWLDVCYPGSSDEFETPK